MSSIPNLRLIYFPVRARAEAARMIMAYGDIPCKEETCNSFFGMTFPEAKKAGKLPFGQLPVLEVTGPGNKTQLIGESQAWVSATFGFCCRAASAVFLAAVGLGGHSINRR